MAIDVLPEFQEFLKHKKIVSDKQIPFYAQWVSRFLFFLNHNSFTKLDIATQQFILWLRDSQHVQDWQLRKAENAVRLYAGLFAGGNTSVLLPAVARDPDEAACDWPIVQVPQRISVPAGDNNCWNKKHYLARRRRGAESGNG